MKYLDSARQRKIDSERGATFPIGKADEAAEQGNEVTRPGGIDLAAKGPPKMHHFWGSALS